MTTIDTLCPTCDPTHDLTVQYAPTRDPDEYPELMRVDAAEGTDCPLAVGASVLELSREQWIDLSGACATAEEQRAYDRYEDAQEAKYQAWKDRD